MKMLTTQAKRVAGLTAMVVFSYGLALATPGQAAQRRDFLVGPVTLGPGDRLLVSVANARVKASCRENAFVRLVAHDFGGVLAAQQGSDLPVDQIVKSALGAAILAPGQSTNIPIAAGQRTRTMTVQVHVETEGLVRDVAPCINVGGTVLRDDGNTQAVSHAQFADDFSILRPSSEAVCIGSADCDQLLTLCEQSSDCSFTCHIAIRNPDGQACVFGSTD